MNQQVNRLTAEKDSSFGGGKYRLYYHHSSEKNTRRYRFRFLPIVLVIALFVFFLITGVWIRHYYLAHIEPNRHLSQFVETDELFRQSRMPSA